MIITVKKGIPEEEVKKLVHTFEERGFQVNDSQGTDYHILGLIGDTTSLDEKIIQANPLVSEVTRIAAPYKKANRMFHPEDTVVDVAGVKIGGQEKIVVIGGPCSVESREQICEIAKEVKAAGADMLRGGNRVLPRMHSRDWRPKELRIWWKQEDRQDFRSSVN